MNKPHAKRLTISLKEQGFSVSEISSKIGKSISSIYLYLREEYQEKRLPFLKQEIKNALLCGDFRAFITSLPYRDLCLIRKEYSRYGYNKLSTIMAILEYFKHYSILGLYPENITRDAIKRAFRRRAKQVHPDTNKAMNKAGKEFQEVYESYQNLMGGCVV